MLITRVSSAALGSLLLAASVFGIGCGSDSGGHGGDGGQRTGGKGGIGGAAGAGGRGGAGATGHGGTAGANPGVAGSGGAGHGGDGPDGAAGGSAHGGTGGSRSQGSCNKDDDCIVRADPCCSACYARSDPPPQPGGCIPEIMCPQVAGCACVNHACAAQEHKPTDAGAPHTCQADGDCKDGLNSDCVLSCLGPGEVSKPPAECPLTDPIVIDGRCRCVAGICERGRTP